MQNISPLRRATQSKGEAFSPQRRAGGRLSGPRPKRPAGKIPVSASGPPTLLKTLRDAGLGSRRDLAEAIKAGRVKVNEAIAESYSLPLKDSDRIVFDGREVPIARLHKIYLALNKPAGVITTTEDEQGRQTVLDLLPEEYKKYQLFPVGRLDEDTTGLVLLTNDGALAYRLTHPRFEVEKEYLVAIDKTLSAEQIEQIEAGIELDDGLSAPARVKPVIHPPYNYRIIIREGKKRIVRRLFAAVGQQVRELKRIRIGRLKLDNLKEGSVKRLTGAVAHKI
ncbi:pseudouridine synthase [Dehalogenimonas alkenigignens]|uniref:pseudouridine synthase n=1 Tax=Dehalogenimonas alkenigignens TaxID=1217799 RepID=UPI001F0B8D38|nr:pseudouridine synthase [Dehalogenimonas alkenigignens]